MCKPYENASFQTFLNDQQITAHTALYCKPFSARRKIFTLRQSAIGVSRCEMTLKFYRFNVKKVVFESEIYYDMHYPRSTDDVHNW